MCKLKSYYKQIALILRLKMFEQVWIKATTLGMIKTY